MMKPSAHKKKLVRLDRFARLDFIFDVGCSCFSAVWCARSIRFMFTFVFFVRDVLLISSCPSFLEFMKST